MITKYAVTPTTAVDLGRQPRRWAAQNLSDTDIHLSIDGESDVTVTAGAKPGILLKAAGAVGSRISSAELGGARLGKKLYAIHGGTGNKELIVERS